MERGGAQKRSQRTVWGAALGLLGGAILLVAFSTLQKWLIGAPFQPRGYIVPLSFGGLTGLLLGLYIAWERQRRWQLSARERLLSALLDAQEVGLAAIDAQHRITRVNRWLRDALGSDPTGELAWVGLFDMDEPPEGCLVEPSGEHGLLMRTLTPIPWRDQRIVDLSSVPLDGGGAILRIEDVTAHVQLDEQRRFLEGRLLEAEKIEAVSRLAEGLVHDLTRTLSSLRDQVADLHQDPSRERLGPLSEALTRTSLLVLRLQELAGGDPIRTTATSPELPEVRVQAPTSGRPPVRTPSVLVVDDEPAVLKLTTRLLERDGFQVLQAASGGEALALFHTSLDLVLLDINLPDQGGPSLYQAMRRQHPGLPVLFCTGAEGLEVAGLPGTSVLRKPFGRDALLGEVRALLAG